MDKENLDLIHKVYEHRLKKAGAVVLWILALFLLAKTFNEFKESRYIGSDVTVQSLIYVSGTGEVVAVPDRAEFNFTVSETALTVADAQREAAEKNNKALKFLMDAGVLEKDIKTTGYNIYPKYEYNQIRCITYPCPSSKEILVGYTVSQSTEVKVKKIEDAGALLSNIGEVGVENISGLRFTVENEDELQREARELAIEDAKDEAKRLAKDLGVRLVRIINFSEGGKFAFPPFFESRAYDSVGIGGDIVPEISVGEDKIISNVNITYEIK